MSWLAIGFAGAGALLGGTGVIGKGGWGGALKGGVIGGSLGYGAGALAGGGAAAGGASGGLGSAGAGAGAGAGNFGLGAWDLGEGAGGSGAAFGAAGGGSALGGASKLGTLQSILGMMGGGQGSAGAGGGSHGQGFGVHRTPVPAPIQSYQQTQPLGVNTDSSFEQWATSTYGPDWRGSHDEAALKTEYLRLHGGTTGGSQYGSNPLQTHGATIAPNIYG